MIVLASASPRRLELLRRAGIELRVEPADIDERFDPTLSSMENVARLAERKARVVAERLTDQIVLGADTMVLLGDRPLGKPTDAEDARNMLTALSGQTHLVTTSVHLLPPRSAEWAPVALTVSTLVSFRALSLKEIDGYVACGEWEGKAGGYAIQGRAAGFVRAVTGSYTNVVGLPLAEVIEELARVGIAPGATEIFEERGSDAG